MSNPSLARCASAFFRDASSALECLHQTRNVPQMSMMDEEGRNWRKRRTNMALYEPGRANRRKRRKGGNHRLVALNGFCIGFSPPAPPPPFLAASFGLRSLSFGFIGVGSDGFVEGCWRLIAARAASRDGPPSAARIPLGGGAGVGTREEDPVGVVAQEWEEGNRWVGQKVWMHDYGTERVSTRENSRS